jgi:hypothetical protein
VGSGHQAMAYGSPELRRKETEGYFQDAPKAGRESADTKREGVMSFSGNYRQSVVFSDEEPSPMGMISRATKTSRELIHHLDRSIPPHSESHRVPYFRYFGPTAIVPGFKQMVVSVREHRRSTGAGSSVASRFCGQSASQKLTASSVSWIGRLWWWRLCIWRNAISSRN